MTKWLENSIWQDTWGSAFVVTSSATCCKAQSLSVPMYKSGIHFYTYFNFFLRAMYAKWAYYWFWQLKDKCIPKLLTTLLQARLLQTNFIWLYFPESCCTVLLCLLRKYHLCSAIGDSARTLISNFSLNSISSGKKFTVVSKAESWASALSVKSVHSKWCYFFCPSKSELARDLVCWHDTVKNWNLFSFSWPTLSKTGFYVLASEI